MQFLIALDNSSYELFQSSKFLVLLIIFEIAIPHSILLSIDEESAVEKINQYLPEEDPDDGL